MEAKVYLEEYADGSSSALNLPVSVAPQKDVGATRPCPGLGRVYGEQEYLHCYLVTNARHCHTFRAADRHELLARIRYGVRCLAWSGIRDLC